MFIEFYNEKQAMDILNYATEKDYDFETGDAAWEISYIQDIKDEYENTIMGAKSEILLLDKDAFIVVSDCYEVTGGQKKRNSLLD